MKRVASKKAVKIAHSAIHPCMQTNYTTKAEKDAQNAKESLSSLPEIEEADNDDDEADEFDLSHITHRDKSREDIIAEAERMAFESMS